MAGLPPPAPMSAAAPAHGSRPGPGPGPAREGRGGSDAPRRRKIRRVKILVIKGAGDLGKKVVEALVKYRIKGHEIQVVEAVSKGSTPPLEAVPGSYLEVEIDKTESITAMFASDSGGLGPFDHVVCCGGSIGSVWRPLAKVKRDSYEKCFSSKALGQIDVVLQAQKVVKEGGSITLTTGVLEKVPTLMSHGIAAVNGAVSAFVRSASLEMPRHIRLNAVSPGVSTRLVAQRPELFGGFDGTEFSEVTKAYIRCVFSPINGTIVQMPSGYPVEI